MKWDCIWCLNSEFWLGLSFSLFNFWPLRDSLQYLVIIRDIEFWVFNFVSAILVCRCYFAQHDKTMLIGADPSHVWDRCIRVTIHHCFFDRTRQRHPRVRFGKVHLYNNYTRNWDIYAVCASVEAQVKVSFPKKLLSIWIISSFIYKLWIFLFWLCMFFVNQIYSQCNIYEAGMKKKTFEFYTEKVTSFAKKSNMVVTVKFSIVLWESLWLFHYQY